MRIKAWIDLPITQSLYFLCFTCSTSPLLTKSSQIRHILTPYFKFQLLLLMTVLSFHNLYSSPNITSVIKSRIMRWAGYVVRMKDRRIAYSISVRRTEGRRTARKTFVIDGRIILKWILKEWDVRGEWTALMTLRIGTGGGRF